MSRLRVTKKHCFFLHSSESSFTRSDTCGPRNNICVSLPWVMGVGHGAEYLSCWLIKPGILPGYYHISTTYVTCITHTHVRLNAFTCIRYAYKRLICPLIYQLHFFFSSNNIFLYYSEHYYYVLQSFFRSEKNAGQ